MRALILVPLGALAVPSVLPLMSIHEVITTGTIDFDAVGKGRGKFPMWLLYSVGWVGFFTMYWAIHPIEKYYANRVMFELDAGHITISGTRLALDEIASVRWRRFYHALELKTQDETFLVHPHLVPWSTVALIRALPKFADSIPDHRASEWLTGNPGPPPW